MLPSVSSLYCAAIVPFFQANVHQIGATPTEQVYLPDYQEPESPEHISAGTADQQFAGIMFPKNTASTRCFGSILKRTSRTTGQRLWNC